LHCSCDWHLIQKMSVIKIISAKIKTKVVGIQQFRAVKHLLKENSKLENVAHSEVCYVIGNGPSLKKHDIKKLSGCKIVMNSFYLHPDLHFIEPDYYIFADPEGQNLKEENIIKWWKEIANHTAGLTTEFIIPVQLAGTEIDKEILADRQKYFVFFQGPLNITTAAKFDPRKPIPHFQNTLGEGLLLAMFMGYKKIVLLGADHDWLSHWNVDTHFYTGHSKPAIGDDVKRPYHWWLNAVNTMFRQYVAIQNVAISKGVCILNCSESGVLDVFPMVPLELSLKRFSND
jgi:hypothetical protein